jgi:uncharacterized protein YdaL
MGDLPTDGAYLGSPLWSVAGGALVGYLGLLAVLAICLVALRAYRPRHVRIDGRHRVARAAAAFAPLILIIVPVTSAEGCAAAPRPPTQHARPATPPVVHPDRVTGHGLHPSVAPALILYDGAGGAEAELTAVQNVNLAAQFGDWVIQRLSDYRPGSAAQYAAIIFTGTNSDTKLPAGLLDDVLGGAVPVLWSGYGLDQLAAREPDRWDGYGIDPAGVLPEPPDAVRYKGVPLPRDRANTGDVMRVLVREPARVLATTEPAAGDQAAASDQAAAGGRAVAGSPWASRSLNLTYVAENPFYWAESHDRYLAYTDLFFDALAPARAERHRALVRLEDVGPEADPENLRAIGEHLYRAGIPFSVAVFAAYADPDGAYHDGEPTTVTLADRPRLVDALGYLWQCGGTLLMHGYTHQHAEHANPYRGVSAEDYEFYLAHIDARDNVVLDGPVPEDSRRWAANRIAAGARVMRTVGLPEPTIFEFPHYAGSAEDYRAVAEAFGVRYERAMYFPGPLAGAPADHAAAVEQFFPYPVRDVYGTAVVPENLGNYVPVGLNNRAARHPADLIATARLNRVVRDGFASFFYHPYLGVGPLAEIIEGIREAGYEFVTPEEALR